MNVRKSPLAARELGISYSRLYWLLRAEKLPKPQKDSSGDFVWTDEDVAAARCVISKGQRRNVSKANVVL